MAVKTFTANEVLTAADTNTYLNNGGLVYVASTSLGSSGATITSAFSATYDVYLVQVKVNAASAQFGLSMSLGGITSGYAHQGYYMTRGSTALNGYNTSSAAQWDIGPIDSAGGFINVTLSNPYASFGKTIAFTAAGSGGTGIGVTGFGYQSSTSSATALTVSGPGGGYTITSGTLTVYGYRKG